MPVDTRNKRASASSILQVFVRSMPLPDHAITQPDRQDLGYSYSGILAAAPPAFNPSWSFYTNTVITPSGDGPITH